MSKTITLPIWNLDIFKELAESYLDNEGIKPSSEEYEDKLEGAIYDLAIEAYLYSFTPSGEIGSNPRTPKIADTFFKEFNDVLGASGFFKTKLKDTRPNYVASRERQYKSAIVSLSQLYMDVQKSVKVKGRQLEDNTYDASAFEYQANKVKGQPTDDELRRMIDVERNRYIRMFMATYFMVVVFDAIKTTPSNIDKLIEDLGLLQEEAGDLKSTLRFLKSPKTRAEFVRKLRSYLDDYKLKSIGQ